MEATRDKSHVFPRAVPFVDRRQVMPGETFRARIDSLVTPAANRVGALTDRRRAVTMIVGGEDRNGPLPKASDAPDPFILEMKRRLIFYGDALNQFDSLNQSIHDFCATCAEDIGHSKQLPQITLHIPLALEGSPVGKAAAGFTSAKDYIFFLLLAIINNRVHEDIFEPFHPMSSPAENDQLKEEQLRKIENDRYHEQHLGETGSSLQLAAATWRSAKFRSIDAATSSDQECQMFRRIISRTIQELHAALTPLPGSTALPDYFRPQLEAILQRAYRWNRSTKTKILDYEFEPYAVKAFSQWNPLQMKPSSHPQSTIPPPRQVISSVSLGLICSVVRGDGRTSLVQRKARVVVEECFLDSLRPRTISTFTPRSVVPRNTPGCIIYRQPSGHPGMSIALPPSDASDRPPPAKKRKRFCCC